MTEELLVKDIQEEAQAVIGLKRNTSEILDQYRAAAI